MKRYEKLVFPGLLLFLLIGLMVMVGLDPALHGPIQAQGSQGTMNGISFGPNLPVSGSNPPQGALSPLFLLGGNAAGLYAWNPVTGQWQNGTNQFATLTADFTDGSGVTTLQAITGLLLNLDGSGQTAPFYCSLLYSQATQVSDAFGVADSVAPTRLDAAGWMNTATTAQTFGNLANLTTTTATAIVTATPTVSTVNGVQLSGTIQQAAGSPGAVQFYVSQATAADVIVIKAGSFCRLY